MVIGVGIGGLVAIWRCCLKMVYFLKNMWFGTELSLPLEKSSKEWKNMAFGLEVQLAH
jgi:hypothetical protein